MSDITKEFDKVKVLLVSKYHKIESNRVVIPADSNNIRILFRIGGLTKDITHMVCSNFAINVTPKTAKVDMELKTGEIFKNINIEFLTDHEYSLWKFKGHEVE